MSKKTLSIILSISVVLNVLFFVFAYVQKVAADNARQLMEMEQRRAETNEKEAMQQKAEAEQQARLAIECQSALQLAGK